MPAGLRGERVLLRDQRRSDLAALHDDLVLDAEMQLLTHGHPWRPVSLEAAEKKFDEQLTAEPDAKTVVFTIERLDDGRIAGDALLWGIDTYQRSAHIGVVLLPDDRSKGVGRDVVRVLCDYAFRLRGLRRLQIETLAVNAAALGAAEAVGFVREGVLRQAEWYGAAGFVDVVVLGLLATEWTAAAR